MLLMLRRRCCCHHAAAIEKFVDAKDYCPFALNGCPFDENCYAHQAIEHDVVNYPFKSAILQLMVDGFCFKIDVELCVAALVVSVDVVAAGH
ncbi:hypothetical protein ACLOJK_034401 [Asimina triloba]